MDYHTATLRDISRLYAKQPWWRRKFFPRRTREAAVLKVRLAQLQGEADAIIHKERAELERLRQVEQHAQRLVRIMRRIYVYPELAHPEIGPPWLALEDALVREHQPSYFRETTETVRHTPGIFGQ